MKPWIKVETYLDFTQATMECTRCAPGRPWTATGQPEVLRGLVEEFKRSHRECREPKR